MKRLFFGLIAVSVFLMNGLNASDDVRLSLSSTTLDLGGVIRLDIWAKSPIKRQQILLSKRRFKAFLLERSKSKTYHYISYVAVARHRLPGNLLLKVDVLLDNGRRFKKNQGIKLDYPPPEKGVVKLSKQKQKLSRDRSQLRKEGRLISKGFLLLTERPYFSKRFVQPAKGRLSSGFGSNRSYNGTYRRSHAGVDFSNKIGTKVLAANGGKVVMSRSLKIHGQTVMIDHGFGVVSIYNHLSKRLVKLGDTVSRGQLVGKMGQTGVATGPHLHWGLSVQGVRVDPLDWVQSGYLFSYLR